MTDTSAEAVELRAQQHDGTSAIIAGLLGAWCRETADLLRALVDERDALMEALKAYDDAMTSCWGAPEYLPDGNPDAARCWPMARAAIAKATRRRPMSKPDTSREAVEMLARFHATSATLYDSDDPEESGGYARGVATAATLRALLAERDAARAQLTDVLAENDALRFSVNNVRAIIEAAYQAGAEAMRRAAADACQTAFQPAPAMDATAVNAVRAGVVMCAAAIRDLPLPKMEDSQ